MEIEEEEEFEQRKLQRIYTPEEVTQAWNERASTEAFIKSIVPRMNPFMAMKMFRDVPRIARALSTDESPDGKVLWKHYFKKFFPARKTDADIDVINQRLQTLKNILDPNQYKEIEAIHFLYVTTKLVLKLVTDIHLCGFGIFVEALQEHK
jgi:hypothetical protein